MDDLTTLTSLENLPPETKRMAALGEMLKKGKVDEADVKALQATIDQAQADVPYLQLMVIALASAHPAPLRADHPALACLTTLLEKRFPALARSAAAQALNQLGKVPEAAVTLLCTMLFDDDEQVRESALLTLTSIVAVAAPQIGAAVSAAPVAAWTRHATLALARSAGEWPSRQRSVVLFLQHGLASGAPAATVIAGYVVLAQVVGDCGAVAALGEAACDSSRPEQSKEAFAALAQLALLAKAAVPVLAGALEASELPWHEALLCQTLPKIGANAESIPLARSVQRVQSAADEAAAAHCMLLSLFASGSEEAAAAIVARYPAASEALKPLLKQGFRAIAGRELAA